jgi:hypothetical protein
MCIGLHAKYPLFLFDFNETLNLLTFSKNPQMLNSMKIRPVGAELFHIDGQTDRHDKANGRFAQFCERA